MRIVSSSSGLVFMLFEAVVGLVLFGQPVSGTVNDKLLAPPLVVSSFRASELAKDLDKLSVALRSNGIIAVQPEDEIEFSHVRDSAFEQMCNCWSSDLLTQVQGIDSGTLSDGKTKRTTLGTATLGNTPLPLPGNLVSACGSDVIDRLDSVRDHVADISKLFVDALDRLLEGTLTGNSPHDHTKYLMRNEHGGQYSSVQSIIDAAKHLEHFHVYTKPGDGASSAKSPTMNVHTDAGLFLAFIPGQNCANSGEERDNQSFYVKDAATGILRRAVFPPGSVAIMLGEGAEHWLETTLSLAATRHTVQMPAGESRAWYGMMHLVPESAFIQKEPYKTFGEMRQAMVVTRENMSNRRYGKLPGVDSEISVGCGTSRPSSVSSRYSVASSRRRRMQHVEGPESCNNSTNFFCWMSCLDIPEHELAEGYTNEGYALYCLDPSVLHSSHRVSQAVEPCTQNGQVGTAMNVNCMGKWAPIAPGVPSQEVRFNRTSVDEEEQFCYGGTSMYMNGFNWVGTTCVIYLFPSWVLNSVSKLVLACIGSILFGIALEYVIRLRRESMSAPSTGPRYKRLAMAASFYGVQLIMGYALMLVIMIYSVPLFLSVIAGVIGGHVLFNTRDCIVPIKKSRAQSQVKAPSGEGKTSTMCEGPCEEPCEQGRCDDACNGCCSDADAQLHTEEPPDHGVAEGSTPCCQHTLSPA